MYSLLYYFKSSFNNMTERIKKGISSNKKKSWRRQISSKDIEDFIYEKGNEDTDIKLISNKSDQDLFTVDSNENDKLQLSYKQRRKLNALKKSEDFKNEENKDNKNDELNVKQRKIFRAIKNGRCKLKLKNKRLKRGSVKHVSKDAWDESAVDDKLEEYKGEWISKELALHHLHGTGRQLVKVHESAHHKTSLLKAFQPPHPGISYNPSYKDYYKLIKEIVEKETDIIKRNEHLNRVTTEMFTKIPIEEHDQLKNLQNMITDEKIKSESTESDEEEDDKTAALHQNPEVNREKKKTKTVRNKEEKLKRLKREKNLEKEKKKQIAELYRIKSILKDISKTEIENEIKCKIQNIKKIQKKFEPKRLSRVKFEEPDVDVFMPNELPNGLRNIETKTKLIVDKFKDFQRRNILPTSVDVGKRKPRKVKHFIRKSHKE